jgi:hypothetical protein
MDLPQKIEKALKEGIPIISLNSDAHYAVQSSCQISKSEEIVIQDGKAILKKSSHWGGDRGHGIDGYNKKSQEKIELPEEFLLKSISFTSSNAGSRGSASLSLYHEGQEIISIHGSYDSFNPKEGWHDEETFDWINNLNE